MEKLHGLQCFSILFIFWLYFYDSDHYIAVSQANETKVRLGSLAEGL